jgi:hypothetical protein
LKDESNKIKLDEWNTKLEKIINQFDNYLDNICCEFPRFYFIEKEQLVEVLSHIRDCRKYINAVKLCFPGVSDLMYDLPGERKEKQEKEMNKDEENKKNAFSLNLDINGKNINCFKNFKNLI